MRFVRTGMLVATVVICASGLVDFSRAEDALVAKSLDQLAKAIKDAGYTRVAVAPSFLLNDQRKNFGNAPAKADELGTPQGLLFSDVVQRGLVRRQGDNFEVVNGDILQQAIRDANVDSLQDISKLQELSKKVGRLDALVTGRLEVKNNFNGPAGMQTTDLSLVCTLIDVQLGADKAIAGPLVRTKSLADAVYEGLSIEIIRPSGGRLLPLGYDSMLTTDPRQSLPLRAANSAEHFTPPFISRPQANPNCPFKVEIRVAGKARKLVYDPTSEDVYVSLDPGKEFEIAVQRSPALQSRDLNFAVFVDGLNILGKKRELPDDFCDFWAWNNQKTESVLRGYYVGNILEPFRIVPIEDSEALKQKVTDRLGLITVVFFNSGWPGQQSFIRRRNFAYQVNSEWNKDLSRWEFNEKWQEMFAAAAPGGGGFAVGGGRAVPFARVNVAADRGPILTAITIRYGTPSEVKQKLARAGNNDWIPPALIQSP